MYDVLVVGGGIAGLRAVVEARRRGAQTALITKAHPLSSYSVTVQDGINAAMSSGDSWESHALDTVRSGDYLADQPVVEAFCQEAPQTLRELDAMGVPFHRDSRGEFAQAMLAGSGQARASHVHDMTGHALTQVLYEQALKAGVQFIEEWYVVSLVNDHGGCRGVVATQLASGRMELFSAKAVVLATGGIRRLYEPSTGSILCSADGIGLAYRAGVSLVDMEMVQYHPCVVKKGRLAVSELLLANGAEVVDGKGNRLSVPQGQPWGTVLARAVAQETAAGGDDGGYVNLRSGLTPEVSASAFYATNARLKMFLKADLTEDPIPVSAAMHRHLGGVATDLRGATDLPGLYAAGECAGNGFHGAGALDGNGLLASVISGRRAGEAAAEVVIGTSPREPNRAFLIDQEDQQRSLMSRRSGDSLGTFRGELAALMHRRVGLIRDESGLLEAAQRVQELRGRYFKIGLKNHAPEYNYELLQYHEIGAMLETAETVVAAAIARQESRGVHLRTDFPDRDDVGWSKHIVIQRRGLEMNLGERPVQVTRWPAQGRGADASHRG